MTNRRVTTLPSRSAQLNIEMDAGGNPVEGQCFTDEQFAYFVACAYIYAARLADAEAVVQE